MVWEAWLLELARARLAQEAVAGKWGYLVPPW